MSSTETGLRLYFHITTGGHWKIIFEKFFKTIKDSGLLAELEQFNLSVLGDRRLVQSLICPLDKKIQSKYHNQNLSLYERPTLKLIPFQ